MNFTIKSLVYDTFSQLTTWFVVLVGAASVLVFIFGIVKFIFKGSSQTERKKGRTFMLWGIIGLFVMFSIWGILEILTGIYGGESVIPQFGNSDFQTPEVEKLEDQGFSSF